jgi:hypothetical protein
MTIDVFTFIDGRVAIKFQRGGEKSEEKCAVLGSKWRSKWV